HRTGQDLPRQARRVEAPDSASDGDRANSRPRHHAVRGLLQRRRERGDRLRAIPRRRRALEHFANIGHLMEPLMATATVTGEVLGTPNETMRAQLGDGEPKLFTPWMAAHD